MKLRAIAIILSIAAGFVVLHTSATAQEAVPTPVAVLLDEFSTTVPCEEGNWRLDGLLVELSNNPVDRGLIVIYDSSAKKRAAWHREQLFRNFMKFRGFGSDRVTFVRGPARAEAKTQFWRVPPGANDPEVLPGDASSVTTEPPPPTKPYIYSTRYVDGLWECVVPMFDLEAYAEVLKENEGNRGNIVIGAGSRAAFNTDEREIRKELEGYGIPRTRIRTFFKKVKPNMAMEFIELWVLPAKPKATVRRDPNRYTVIGSMDAEPSIPTGDVEDEVPDPPAPPPPPARRPKNISGGILNSKAKTLPKPPYPSAARAVSAEGAVTVEVTIDELGNVISAKAVSGHPLLRASAVQAARQAKFPPTQLSGVAVQVIGVIVYNFVP
jgi:TonB family protein